MLKPRLHERIAAGSAAGRSSRLALARIAIADDDPESLDLLRSALFSPTNRIDEATSGAELVELLAEGGPFDLVITDVSMPWMEGLRVLQSARAADVRTPVLVVSGLSRPDLEGQIVQLGNARLLRKPFAVTDLRRAVSELLAVDTE